MKLPAVNRQGFALPTAIVALVVVGLMVVGGLGAVAQEFRIGLGTERSTRALYGAEQGITQVLSTWEPAVMGSLALFEPLTLTGTTEDVGWIVDVSRVSERGYFLDAEATVTDGGQLSGATRRLGAMVKVRTAQLAPPGALTTRGNVSVRGTAEVRGEDVNPITWGGVCAPPAAGSDRPGVITDATGNVTTQGAAEISGNPASVRDSTITEDSFRLFGDMTWDDLTALANLTYGGGSFNGLAPRLDGAGDCDVAHMSNWGDPINPDQPCGSYFPIIYVGGSATIQSGAVGQGILLVDGDLDLRGNFIWHGIVVVQGELGTQGSGNRILGGVWAGNADLENQALVGGSVVQYSSCAADRAVLNNPALSRARPLSERGWLDLSNAAGSG